MMDLPSVSDSRAGFKHVAICSMYQLATRAHAQKNVGGVQTLGCIFKLIDGEKSGRRFCRHVDGGGMSDAFRTRGGQKKYKSFNESMCLLCTRRFNIMWCVFHLQLFTSAHELQKHRSAQKIP